VPAAANGGRRLNAEAECLGKERRMNVADVARAVESMAPPELAEEWDNVGLLVGDAAAAVRKLLVCTDLTEAVLAEALAARAQMVVAHHPVIFKSIRRVTASEAPVVYKALRRGLAVYAAHTNLDAAPGGPSDVLADVLHLTDRRPLEAIARRDQCKVTVFLPPSELSTVAGAAFAAGAGRIGRYRDCGFFCHGLGSYCGGEGTHPTIGEPGRPEIVEELRLEVLCPRPKAAAVREAIRAAHSYEEPAIDTYVLEDSPAGCGWGRVGTLRRPVTVQTLIRRLKRATGARKVQLAAPSQKGGDGRGMLVTTAACFSGSGGGYYRKALAQGAMLYVTGEMGHHDALDAVAHGMAVICLGHGHSERIAMARLAERLGERLPRLKVVVSKRDRDPYAIV